MCIMETLALLVKVMTKVNVFQKQIKVQGQGQKLKSYGIMWKVLSQAIHVQKPGLFW